MICLTKRYRGLGIKGLNGQRITVLFLLLSIYIQTVAQVPQPLKVFLQKPALKGASVAFMAKEVGSGNVLYSYESDREMTPASVMKTVTAATALEVLGKDFKFETSVLYDGEISNGVLNGNLYLYGGGDPTLNSSELKTYKDSILMIWTSAIRQAGIKKISGQVIADESIFDTEGVSMKWLREDMGNSYSPGSYGLNIFDNTYTLYVTTGATGTQPTLLNTQPHMPLLQFYNYLSTKPIPADSCTITGMPFSNERYLYGAMRTYQSRARIPGDIPDPALYLAQYFSDFLMAEGIEIDGSPTCYRVLSQAGKWKTTGRKTIITTYSPPLEEITRIALFVSHNLYADALLKTLGLRYQPGKAEVMSSFEKGANAIKDYWNTKGINASSLWMYDGSGLAVTDKVSVEFLCDLYIYMSSKSDVSNSFIRSLPRPGIEGTVRNTLRGSKLQGKSHLKSGSMNRVLCYGGYIVKDDKQYAVALLVNSFSGRRATMRAAVEELLLALF
ncbi:MAG: D-alanyl-D-alanine carboxypeptidase/D-alanyl-D-alanine-endopeptidase [Tannerella sp.]|jgi:D-alanyl-D-alanine carboxypeptidase/D-alanyl-D-alanine-endopeptidase (penicillin-binding protein 4)|nr:D-alanyl-D-alanine carboxypeptidase/D-alanyl-D-alanine-endopeptidase [Tannerella sp.]